MSKRRPSGDGMVRKRSDGRWEGRIVVGHKDDGAPIFRYVYGKTQKELTEKLHRKQGEYDGAELGEGSEMTLAAWLDKWLDKYMKGTIRENTLHGYKGYCENYIKPYIGEKKVSQITPTDIINLYATLRDHGRIHARENGMHDLADATIARVHAMLHKAMKTAAQEHMIVKNPIDSVPAPSPNYKPKQILNEEQLERFMAEIETDEAWRDFFYTELTTGLRRGEICGLKWEDFDEVTGKLKVVRSVDAKTKGDVKINLPKTQNSIRTIILPPKTAQILRERKRNSVSEWIFPNFTDPVRPINPSLAYHHMKTILKRAGLPDIRFHDLRHPKVKPTTKKYFKIQKPQIGCTA